METATMERVSPELRLEVAEALEAAGEDGLGAEEVARIARTSARIDHQGFLANELRRDGFLVQVEGQNLYILKLAPIAAGYWVRHRQYGVVLVRFEREGFDMVVVSRPGRCADERLKVSRGDLSGV